MAMAHLLCLDMYYGMEFLGRLDKHPYELFLHINDIEHTRTMVRRPQTNGSVERLNQTIQNEFYQVAFRKKLYHSIENIQADLDSFMDQYNIERTNQGRYCQGAPPCRPSWTAWSYTNNVSIRRWKTRRQRSNL